MTRVAVEPAREFTVEQSVYSQLKMTVSIHRVMFDRLIESEGFPSSELIALLEHFGNSYTAASQNLRKIRDAARAPGAETKANLR